MTKPPIRLLVVDDSAYNRRNIADVFATYPEVEVVGKAADGEEALRLATLLKPDVITLDLEMPRMDGFTFLRILMSRRPTPVLVVSGWGAKENVFKALELGALDFIVKPSRQLSPDLRSIRDELVNKVKLVTQLKMLPLQERALQTNVPGRRPSGTMPVVTMPVAPDGADGVVLPPFGPAPPVVIAIGASTGGPPALQQVITSLDPKLPIEVEVLDTRVRQLSARQRFNATLLALFAAFALALAAIGLAGVVSYLVTQRTRELGVRMALGATPGNIRALVLNQSLRWILAGAAAGFVAGLLATRSLKSLLFQVEPNDPLILSLVTAVLIAVGILSAWLPARRAARLDPLVALRHD